MLPTTTSCSSTSASDRTSMIYTVLLSGSRIDQKIRAALNLWGKMQARVWKPGRSMRGVPTAKIVRAPSRAQARASTFELEEEEEDEEEEEEED
jgi:hypothetical protein